MAWHPPHEVDAPRVIVRVERQGLEGYPHLGRPAFIVAHRLRLPDALPVLLTLIGVLEKQFGANSVGVDFEPVTAAPIVERIEVDSE